MRRNDMRSFVFFGQLIASEEQTLTPLPFASFFSWFLESFCSPPASSLAATAGAAESFFSSVMTLFLDCGRILLSGKYAASAVN